MKTICNGATTLALLAVALTALPGCGGTQNLTRDQLIAKADPACRQANEKLKSSKINPHNAGSVAVGLAATYARVSDELARLTPPPSMTSDWKVIVDQWRKSGRDLERVAQAAKTKNATAQFRATALFSKDQLLRSLTATHNGFHDCASY